MEISIEEDVSNNNNNNNSPLSEITNKSLINRGRIGSLKNKNRLSDKSKNNSKKTAGRTPSATSTEDGDEDVTTAVGGPNDRYLRGRLLGVSRGKDVYRATDTEQGIDVAWIQRSSLESEFSSFEPETVQLLRSIHQPNILQFLDYWDVDGDQVMITELISGGSLSDFMRRTGKCRPKVVQSWCRQILKALQYLHGRKPSIIHRNLNPSSVFIDSATGKIKVGELSLACPLNQNVASGVVGEAAYRAPEMYSGEYNELVDVYAFGLTVLELCTQECPFYECQGDEHAIVERSRGVGPLSVCHLQSVATKEFVLACINPNPSQRLTVKNLLHHAYLDREDSLSPPPHPRMTFQIQKINKDGSFAIRLSKFLQKRRDSGSMQSIDFTLDLGEEPELVADLLHQEGLVQTSEKSEVSAGISTLVSCVDTVINTEDIRILAQANADLQARLASEKNAHSDAVQSRLKEVLEEQARQRRELMREQVMQLEAIMCMLDRPTVDRPSMDRSLSVSPAPPSPIMFMKSPRSQSTNSLNTSNIRYAVL